MATFNMTCSCGDTMTIDADNREEAVSKMKAMMTQEAVDTHMAQYHAGQSMAMADVHAGIEKDLQAV